MRNYFVGARVRPKINTKGKSVDENEKKVEDMKDYFKIDDSDHLRKYLKANRLYDSERDSHSFMGSLSAFLLDAIYDFLCLLEPFKHLWHLGNPFFLVVPIGSDSSSCFVVPTVDSTV